MRLRKSVIVSILLALLAVVWLPGVALASGGGEVVMGQPITIAADEVHDGDVISMGGPVDVLGRVTGDVIAFGGPVHVEGEVDGDVVTFGGPVTLGPHSVVRGDVRTMGGTVERAPGAQVFGQVWTNAFPFHHGMPGMDNWRWFMPGMGPWGWFGAGMYLLYVAGLFALAVMVHALFPQPVARWSGIIEAEPVRTGLVGLAAMILFYPAVLLIAVTIIGIPVAMALVIAYSLGRLGGYVAVAGLLGRKILPGRDPLLTLAAGVALLGLLHYVPVVGWVSGILVAALAVGAIVQTRFGTRDAVRAGGPTPPAPPAGGDPTPPAGTDAGGGTEGENACA
ncbi:MAG: hypothetical protein IMW98_09930 [Firmicutes bacterium]|nr:hypothetical protein [Bacillota bacterium]